jgi:ABC-type sugar transport system substrate-binding protein
MLSLTAALGLGAATSAAAGSPPTDPATSAKNAAAVVEFDKAGAKTSKPYRIAYLTECVDNPYCVTRLNAIKEAAGKFGVQVKVFDAQWSLVNEAKALQNAAAEGFDGYLFGPLAAQPSCSSRKRSLAPTGKPVVSVTVPMCGDADHRPGLAATFTMQAAAHYQELADAAFSSCDMPCKAIVIGGFIGSDLQRYWETANRQVAAKYPNVTIAAMEAANFDPHRDEKDAGRLARPSGRHGHRVELG